MRACRPMCSLEHMTRRGTHNIAVQLHRTPSCWALRTATLESIGGAMRAARSVLDAANR